jgi:putative IMPACT (imprinted ancient) family translation regulator
MNTCVTQQIRYFGGSSLGTGSVKIFQTQRQRSDAYGTSIGVI